MPRLRAADGRKDAPFLQQRMPWSRPSAMVGGGLSRARTPRWWRDAKKWWLWGRQAWGL